ncbi:cobalamin biosynthesis protein [Aureimonas populi]|uniref:Cobalamin biosynthesis protein n=1 Tax=Aureimonas populi TaxID=1701758 RepID=A0ABW5CLB6_9HYPH|nr:cobalamin biosynthesis protein [Aureimonas populi]
MGCRRGASAGEVVAALEAALKAHGLGPADLDALAVIPAKAGEPGVAEAARRLRLPLHVVSPETMDAAAAQGLTRSAASLAATSTPSASEAAALAATGGRLLGPRIKLGPVTCAIAESLS